MTDNSLPLLQRVITECAHRPECLGAWLDLAMDDAASGRRQTWTMAELSRRWGPEWGETRIRGWLDEASALSLVERAGANRWRLRGIAPGDAVSSDSVGEASKPPREKMEEMGRQNVKAGFEDAGAGPVSPPAPEASEAAVGGGSDLGDVMPVATVADAQPGDEDNGNGAVRVLFELDELLSIDELERAYVHHVLDSCDNNKVRAAQVLQINPSTLHRKLARWRRTA